MKEKIKSFLVGKWNDVLAVVALFAIALLFKIITNTAFIGDLNSQVIRLFWFLLPVAIFLLLLGGAVWGNRKIWRIFLLMIYAVLTFNTLTGDMFMIKFLYHSNADYMPNPAYNY